MPYSRTTTGNSILANLSTSTMSLSGVYSNMANIATALGVPPEWPTNRRGTFYLDGPGYYPEDRDESWVRTTYTSIHSAIQGARTAYCYLPEVPWVDVVDNADGVVVATISGDRGYHNSPKVEAGRGSRHE